MCHHNTFLVYQSMRDATMEKWERITHFSVGFAWVLATLFGVAGYATFKALSQGMRIIMRYMSETVTRATELQMIWEYMYVFYIFTGDLLENYCWDDDLMNFARFLFSLSILLTYPIECFVSREVLLLVDK